MDFFCLHFRGESSTTSFEEIRKNHAKPILRNLAENFFFTLKTSENISPKIWQNFFLIFAR